MSKCLIAEYETGVGAKLGLKALEKGGFTLEKVSVVSKTSDPAAEHLDGLQNESASDAATDGRATSLGMLIGGSVAAPFAVGTLVGPLIIAGPLVGMAVGAAIGSLLSSMEKWGVDESVSSDYEQRVKSGSSLVIVHDVEDDRLVDAEATLRTTDPKSLELYEAS